MGGTDNHGHSGDAGHGDVSFDIIPESSIQDKALVLLAVIVLASLLGFGFQWALSPIAG
jgi:hypothetical protein